MIFNGAYTGKKRKREKRQKPQPILFEIIFSQCWRELLGRNCWGWKSKSKEETKKFDGKQGNLYKGLGGKLKSTVP